KAASAPDLRALGERLAAWDCRMRADAAEPLLFHALWDAFARGLLEEELGARLFHNWASQPHLAQERLAAILEDPWNAFWLGRERLALPSALEGPGTHVARGARDPLPARDCGDSRDLQGADPHREEGGSVIPAACLIALLAAPVTVESLLAEMTDLDRLAEPA